MSMLFTCPLRPHQISYTENQAVEHLHIRTNYLSYQYRLSKIHVIGIWEPWRRYRMRKIMQIPRQLWSSFWKRMDLYSRAYWRNTQKIKQGLYFYHTCLLGWLFNDCGFSYIEEFWYEMNSNLDHTRALHNWCYIGTSPISRIVIQSYSRWTLISSLSMLQCAYNICYGVT